ncbi:tyrosine recombinase XerC [Microbacterium sp. MYb62]|uniref:site-specific integrase n=1 Tax=Microbacterium sp. MYb62 TaxID=1848690 RepID=UPI000CFB823D|nr:tyrosine-type recombinase/integrase [Microbacterium sp. MYb62]PRB18899.1 hypothetical protein CQ042_00325 [Microbacterium sp. MYb62]
MAGRRPLNVGELGLIKFGVVNGKVAGRARTRDAGGTVRRLYATGTSQEEVAELLANAAARLSFEVEAVSPITKMSTMLDLRIEDRDGQVRPQSLRLYKHTVSWLTPLIGGITIGEMTPARVKKVLQNIEQERSASAARSARIALSGAFGIAVELDALQHNPIRSLRRKKPQRRIPKALNPHQVAVFRKLVLEREEGVGKHAGDGGVNILRWVTEVMLGSGLRISEVLALRNMDVEVKVPSGRVSVTGTMAEPETGKAVRQDELKSREQARYIALPRYAREVFLEARSTQTELSARLPLAPALPGRRGNAIPARSVNRALRVLREHPEMAAALAETGLVPKDFTPHLLRRTAATLVAVATGDLRSAQELLGHADIATTRDWYAGLAFRNVGSAEILDEILGDGPAA